MLLTRNQPHTQSISLPFASQPLTSRFDTRQVGWKGYCDVAVKPRFGHSPMEWMAGSTAFLR